MGTQTFNFTGSVDTSFTALPGFEYTFTVTGAGGGGGDVNNSGGNGAIVTATYSGLTSPTPLTIIVGGGGKFAKGTGSGGGLTQVFSTLGTDINIIAGGGGGGGFNKGLDAGNPIIGPVPPAGTTGGTGGNYIGATGGNNGSGDIGGTGGSNGGDGLDGQNNSGGGGGSAHLDGTVSFGGNYALTTAAFNGGGGLNTGNGGGGGGFGGGGGGSYGGGGGGGSIALGTFLKSVSYSNASFGTLPGGGGGGGVSSAGFDGQVIITSIPTPTSNICFPVGTPVQTDQGIFSIEKLDKEKHTIHGEPILQITKTVTLDSYLISFEKNSIGRNIPNKKTIMSKDHKIHFEGQLVPAYRFLNFSREVKKVKYSGEVLYNVLLSKYSLMNVNGLICETLHPENIIAKLYIRDFTKEERNDIIILMNDALKQGDLIKYKSSLARI
jgi:hypothetical protein